MAARGASASRFAIGVVVAVLTLAFVVTALARVAEIVNPHRLPAHGRSRAGQKTASHRTAGGNQRSGAHKAHHATGGARTHGKTSPHQRSRSGAKCRAGAHARAAKRHRNNVRRCAVATRSGGPTAPSSLRVTTGNGQVSLAWRASRGHNKIAGYRVFRSGARVGRTVSTGFVDTGLSNGRTYAYHVVAYDKRGKVSRPSSTVFATPQNSVGSPGSQSVTCGWGSFGNVPSFNIPSACWRPFADSSWLNTPLPGSPRLATAGVDGENGNSSQLVSALMNHGNGNVRDLEPVVGTSWQHAMYFSSPSDPVYTLSCAHSSRDCNQQNSAIGEQVHIPCGARVPNGTDMQVFVIDQTSGYEYDLAGLTPGQVLCGGGTFYVSLATKISELGDGRSSCAADAACVGMSAGQIREPELAAGSINHAIFIVNGVCDNSGTPMSLYPADPDNSCGGNYPAAPKVGQWYYLALSDQQIAATGFPEWQQTILRAMSHYGMFVGDQGSNGAFDIMSEDQGTWDSFHQANPWVAYAQSLAGDPANNIQSASNDSVDLGMDNIPDSFWTNNLRAVDPCVIQRTC